MTITYQFGQRSITREVVIFLLIVISVTIGLFAVAVKDISDPVWAGFAPGLGVIVARSGVIIFCAVFSAIAVLLLNKLLSPRPETQQIILNAAFFIIPEISNPKNLTTVNYSDVSSLELLSATALPDILLISHNNKQIAFPVDHFQTNQDFEGFISELGKRCNLETRKPLLDEKG